jgi:phosphoribosyl-AMP cyclohydrolase
VSNWINNVRWDSNGLLPVIVQDASSNKVIMFAWMNRETLEESIKQRKAIYWSRSRKQVWVKGEESGHYQNIEDMFIDCDNDVLLIKVKQEGGIACHTGRERCFYNRVIMKKNEIEECEKIIKDPKDIYKGKK